MLEATSPHGIAIDLLVDHTHSIPVRSRCLSFEHFIVWANQGSPQIPRVISQLQDHRKYLYMYLDALFDKDAHLAFDYSDLQVDLYAEFKPDKLMDFLRASNYYSLERAYQICDARDLVPEMVFLLGRMGDNKRALTLIIERLGDVQRAIDFAREQNDTDLWEDLLKYCETKPSEQARRVMVKEGKSLLTCRCTGFIRGLLENVGVDVDPIRLIRRIQNGLEIPGLKPALIKILQDFQLQVRCFPGCASSRNELIVGEFCRSRSWTVASRFSTAIAGAWPCLCTAGRPEDSFGPVSKQCSAFGAETERLTMGFSLLLAGDTTDYSTGEPIFPHLSGGAIPAILPFGVRGEFFFWRRVPAG